MSITQFRFTDLRIVCLVSALVTRLSLSIQYPNIHLTPTRISGTRSLVLEGRNAKCQIEATYEAASAHRRRQIRALAGLPQPFNWVVSCKDTCSTLSCRASMGSSKFPQPTGVASAWVSLPARWVAGNRAPNHGKPAADGSTMMAFLDTREAALCASTCMRASSAALGGVRQ